MRYWCVSIAASLLLLVSAAPAAVAETPRWTGWVTFNNRDYTDWQLQWIVDPSGYSSSYEATGKMYFRGTKKCTTCATTAATNGFIVYAGCQSSVKLLDAALPNGGFAFQATSTTREFQFHTSEPPPTGRPTALSPMVRFHSYLQFPQGPGASSPPAPQIELARIYVTNDGAYRC